MACILVIACVNVAGLLIARGAARTQELAVRAALGASRWRLVRQLVTESLVLALLGGLAGTLLAWWGVGALVPKLPVRLPTDMPVSVDLRVLSIALAASTVTGVLFGALPALRLSRGAFAGALKESGRTTSRWGRRTGSALVLVEVALSLVLLAGAGLLVRTVTALYAVDAGIASERVLAMRTMPLLPADAPPERQVAFFREIVSRVAAIPGVDAAAAIDTAPFSGSTRYTLASARDSAEPVPVSPRSISSSYFKAMEIPLLAGRDFEDADGPSAPKVVIVNGPAARRLWPGQNRLGQHVRYKLRGGLGEPLEVVGVVGNVRHQGLDQDVLNEVYHPFAQRPDDEMTIVAHTPEPHALAPVIAAQVKELPERAIAGPVRTLRAE